MPTDKNLAEADVFAIGTKLLGALDTIYSLESIDETISYKLLLEYVDTNITSLLNDKSIFERMHNQADLICAISPLLQAPELISHGLYSKSADIFFIGALLTFLFTGAAPENYPYNEHSWFEKIESLSNKNIRKLLAGLVTTKPEDRHSLCLAQDICEDFYLCKLFGKHTKEELRALQRKNNAYSRGKENTTAQARINSWLSMRLEDLQ